MVDKIIAIIGIIFTIMLVYYRRDNLTASAYIVIGAIFIIIGALYLKKSGGLNERVLLRPIPKYLKSIF